MIAVRNAVAPVAQALVTLYTGIPVWPTCFWSIWPKLPPPIRFPAARTPMSRMLTPASVSAAMTASAPRSTMSLSECFPNFVIAIPRIQMSSLAMMIPLVVVVEEVTKTDRGQAAGSKPNPMASTPSSSVPRL